MLRASQVITILGLSIIALTITFVLTAPAVVAADCPCGWNPPFKCCGDMTCDIWSNQATYVTGGTCSPKKNYYCCVNGGPFRRSAAESTEVEDAPFEVQFVERGNRPFDGLTNGVHVRMLVNGKPVPGPIGHGRFVDGYLKMKDGTRYLVLAGDLFLVYD